MTRREKNTIIARLNDWLERELVTEDESADQTAPTQPQPPEMLTLKECAETVKGLSEHTVRQLVLQGKVPCIRTGAGKNGKILVNKAALLAYVGGGAA